ncbi:hypothetical protein TeGR_g2041 [Tetraparma gracilis]|uniref:EF-hand domain-containing protein n=1 Tax=Tetraparma gracilis TaxID=2962635 RepID=A0ABQ6N1G3_9STRA|nr:hypothetical protein TeGR_g2041 [Tetraparma gracilis]
MSLNPLSSSLPFPLRPRKLQTLSGSSLSAYSGIASLSLACPPIHSFEPALASLRSLLLAAAARPEFLPVEPARTHPLLSSLSSLLHRYDLDQAGALPWPLFSRALAALLPGLPAAVLEPAFRAFALAANAPSADIEMFLAVAAHWLAPPSPSAPGDLARTPNSLAAGACRPRDSVCELIVPDEAPDEAPLPAAPRFRPRGPLPSPAAGLLSIPSRVASLLSLLAPRLPLFLELAGRLSPRSPLVELDELRMLLGHCSVCPNADAWGQFKDYATESGFRDKRDPNLIDYAKVAGHAARVHAKSAAPQDITERGYYSPAKARSAPAARPEGNPDPPPPLPPHSLLLQVAEAWPGVLAALQRQLPSPSDAGARVPFPAFCLALRGAGVILSDRDAESLYAALTSLRAGEPAPLSCFLGAFPVPAPAAPGAPDPADNVLVSAGDTALSGAFSTHQKRHFSRGVFGHSDAKRIGM